MTQDRAADLAERVIHARETLGLTQQEAADLVGVSLVELQQLEVQAMTPSMPKARLEPI